MRGKLGAVEVRGGELLAAAEAHDALFSFDYRARTAALEVGLPLLPRRRGPVRQPRPARRARRRGLAAHDLAGRRPARRRPRRASASSSSSPSAARTATCSASWSSAHRKRGALVALDDMSGGAESLQYLELLRPDVVKIDNALTAGIQHSPARRRLVAALVDCAHEQGCKVVAEGVERVDEFQAMADLGVDLGQGYYFGQPTEKPMAVDVRLVRPRAELV